MGKPLVLTACSSCLKIFRDHLPKIEAESVWGRLALHPPTSVKASVPMALSDPCTARDDYRTQRAVRDLLGSFGQPLTPLVASGEMTECCGFGGLMQNANAEVAAKTTEARVAQTESEILTYCAMCRDQLARTGKPVSHILDLLFPECSQAATEPSPTISDRRKNRRELKTRLLKERGEKPGAAAEWENVPIHVDNELLVVLEKRRILEDDIRQVLHITQEQKSALVHEKCRSRIASARLGQVTFWVQYRDEGGMYFIESCWSHRMSIVGGRV